MAVLAVVLFHLDLAAQAGGFAGVDVFLVISGYLITGRLAEDMASTADRPIIGFFERRARRIIPALAVMLVVCSALAWRLLLPPDIVGFGWNLGATSLFASNAYLLSGTGYFADSARLMPLLHTWSLAIEEQFYLVLPLVLWIGRRWLNRRHAHLLATLAVASFVVALMVHARSDKAAFYLGPTRAWEMLLGGWLAVAGLAAPHRRWPREIAALSGVAMILWAMFGGVVDWIDGPLGLTLPCIGTALVLWAAPRPGDVSRRVLSWKPIAAVGLISYSLYLWHWPLVVFYKATLALEGATTITLGAKLGVLLVSMAIATVSWRLICAFRPT